MDASLLIELGMAPIAFAAFFYVLMLRPWRPRRMLARRAPGIDLLFVLTVAMASTAVLEPAPFDRAAIALIEATSLPASLAEIDRRIDEVENLPETMWQDLTARLGWGSAAQTEAAEAFDPATGVASSSVLPAVHGILSMLMRSFTWVGCLFALILVQIMRGLAGLRQREPKPPTLRPFDKLIDDRVAALEEALHTRSRGQSALQPEG